MPFKQLYDAVQTQGDRISTKWLRTKAIEFSKITKIKEQWSGVIDPRVIRGFYIEGPKRPPVALEANQALIVLAREMCNGHLGDHWRRAILAKELMHVFDEEDEKTNDRTKFDNQIRKFGDPKQPTTPQYQAEAKAYWRALSVLCTDKKRLEYKEMLAKETISWDVAAAALRIPVSFLQDMMDEKFEVYRDHSM